MKRKLRALLAGLALLGGLVQPVWAGAAKTVAGNVSSVVARLTPTGRLAATNRLELMIGLPLHHRETLTNLLRDLYDPGSANFHRYLTPEQFTATFGPTKADYDAVLQFLRTNGLTVARTYADRRLVAVSAGVGDIERALHVTLRTYRHPTESREFYAPEADPSVDAGVPIQSISGLENYHLPQPAAHLQPVTSSGNQPALSGTGPNGYLQGQDFRSAYANGVTLAGEGQAVGLVEFDGYYTNDIILYESQIYQSAVPLTNVLLSGSSGFPDNNTNNVAECSLDIEMVVSMAPNLGELYVFEGNSFDEILENMVLYPQIKQFSASWVGFSFDSTGDDFFQEMIAQGQSFFQASGDGDAYTQPVTPPSDDPFATIVGGTVLSLDETGEYYYLENVWNSGFQVPGWGPNGAYTQGTNAGGYWGSGGGVSTTYPIPGWQTGAGASAVGGSSSYRNIPDVAMPAANIWVDYFNGLQGPFGGTSCAAPLWAGFTALVNQEAAIKSKPAVGFLNPALYYVGEHQNYQGCFHDITIGNDEWPGSPNAFQAAKGYDLCTGWGSPNGFAMINSLVGLTGPVYVDFNYTGSAQNGTYNYPYKTLAAAIAGVGQKGTIFIKSGSSPETPTISKPMTITTLGGTASIGK